MFEKLNPGVEVKILNPNEFNLVGVSGLGSTGTILKCELKEMDDETKRQKNNYLKDEEGEEKTSEIIKYLESLSGNTNKNEKPEKIELNKITEKFENMRKEQGEMVCDVEVKASMEIKGSSLQLVSKVVTIKFSATCWTRRPE